MKVRLLITDDHDVVRQGLRLYLRREPEIDLHPVFSVRRLQREVRHGGVIEGDARMLLGK